MQYRAPQAQIEGAFHTKMHLCKRRLPIFSSSTICRSLSKFNETKARAGRSCSHLGFIKFRWWSMNWKFEGAFYMGTFSCKRRLRSALLARGITCDGWGVAGSNPVNAENFFPFKSFFDVNPRIFIFLSFFPPFSSKKMKKLRKERY